MYGLGLDVQILGKAAKMVLYRWQKVGDEKIIRSKARDLRVDVRQADDCCNEGGESVGYDDGVIVCCEKKNCIGGGAE